MKLTRFPLLAALAASLVTLPVLRAQDSHKPEKPELGKGGIDGIRVPDSIKNDAKLKELLAAAKLQRETFVAAQKKLAETLKGATADQKAAIKEQLKANKEQFLADTKQLRTDIRERIKELKAQLKPGNVGGGAENGGHRRGGG